MSDRQYELIAILDPTLGEAETETLVGQIKTIVTETGGTIDNVDEWGKKRLAYTIKKHRDGFYVLITFGANADVVSEIDRRLKVTDAVLKFQTVRIDVELRKAERRKKRRNAQEERRKERFAARRNATGVQ